MIKKILSVVLTVAMLLTLVSSLPVAAAGEALPYIFEDFEADGDVAGPYGIGKALKTDGTYYMAIEHLESLLDGDVKVSFNIKADEETAAKVDLVSECDLGTLPANEWVAIEEIITVGGAVAATLAITADSAFAIDDLRVEDACDKDRKDLSDEEEAMVKSFSYDFTSADYTDVLTVYAVDNSTEEKTDVTDVTYYNRGSSSRPKYNALIEPETVDSNTSVFVEVAVEEGFVSPKYDVLRQVDIRVGAMKTQGVGAEFSLNLGNGDVVAYSEEEDETVTVTSADKIVFGTKLKRATGSTNPYLYTATYKQAKSDAASDETLDKIVFELKAKEDQEEMDFYIQEITVTDTYLPANANFDKTVEVEETAVPLFWAASNAAVAATEGAATVTATAANPAISQTLALENDYKYVASFSASADEGKTLVVSFGDTTKEFTFGEEVPEGGYSVAYRAETDGNYAYPELKFALKDAATEDVFSVASIEVSKEYNYKLAKAENIEVAGVLAEKNIITVSYDEASDEDIEVLTTVVNLFQEKGDYTVLVDTTTETADENEVEFELPADCADSEFYVEVICFTAAGQGESVESAKFEVGSSIAYSDYSAELTDTSATVSFTLENNRAEGADAINAIVLVVLLDENGVLIGSNTTGEAEITTIEDLEAGSDSEITVSAEALEGKVATDYKVFVLDCGDSEPSLATATMRELVTLE